MRVAVVENAIGYGGSTVCAGQILDACLRAGIEPILLISYDGRGVGKNLPADSVWQLERYRLFRWGRRLRRLGQGVGRRLPGVVQSVFFAVAWYLCEWPCALQLAARLRRNRVDIVHANNDLLNNRIAIAAGYLAGAVVISHQRGWQWPGRFSRSLAKKVRCFVAISQCVARDLARVVPDPSRIRQVYDGVDCAAIGVGLAQTAPSSRFGILPDRIVIGMPAMLVEWKGQDVFLRAFARLVGKRRDVHALLIGDAPHGDGAIRASLKRLVGELGIADRVEFGPFCKEPAEWLASMDIVVHASTRPEPLGLTVLEAMAAGKPVVAADAGGVRETVVPGRTGLVFPPGDADALADCLDRLVASPSLRATLGCSARQHVNTHYSLRLSQEGIVELYRSVVKDNRAEVCRKVICPSRPCYS
jgi:glycosyltransferase involved in cell wall biosynthesis